MTSQIFESKSIFAFDAVALWNLKTLESYLSSPNSQHLLTFERASIYASLILNLYVYIEGNMNHGLKNIHNTTPKNPTLRDHIVTQTKFNFHPFEVLKWIDIEY